ncbi:MAG: chemotaxis protein CheC [Pirellulales bacterium]|nr:chemotaxis protein CheC [Pirellulales bacterium]
MNASVKSARVQSLFQEIFASATQSASESLRGWTSGQISLELDDVHELPMEEVTSQLEVGEEMLTIIALTLEGELGGQIILTFDEENGRQLAATLLNRELNLEGDWSALEISALKETGNILACAYVHTISELIGKNLIPSPPHFIQDFGASVLQQAVMAQAMTSDRVLVCRTTFLRGKEALDWRVFFVPDHALLSEIHATVQSAS